MKCFIEPEAHRINGPEIRVDPQGVDLVDQLVRLADGEDFRKCGNVLQFKHGKDVPVSFAGAGVKELHSREGDTQRSVGESAVILEMQEESPNVVLGDLIGGAFGEIGELSDGADVSVVCPLCHSGEMQVFAESLSELLGEVGP